MTATHAERRGHSIAVRLLLAAVGVALAAGLIWLSASVHLERACVVMDTPYLPICPGPASDAELQGMLRARIATNPGDSSAWIQLANVERSEHEKALLRAASTLAPTEPNVLMWRAGEALSARQFPQAVDLLVELIEYRGKGEAAAVLAQIVASGQSTALLSPHVATASRWLPSVLASLTALKLPVTSAQPLVADAWAKGTISRQTLQSYIRSLKADGDWADAYSLWLTQQKGSTPLLHNGRFDTPFQPDGFDWEVTPELPSRAGAAVSQRGSGNRGQVLDIQFTGKPLSVPLIRQYVFAPPGRYVFRGQYMGSRLRTEQGLAWTARCTNRTAAAATAGRSGGLQDTGGVWQNFQFDIVIPPDCGMVISLQLETFAPFEAATGLKGRAAFDALELMPQRL
jgi:hypothetical protein